MTLKELNERLEQEYDALIEIGMEWSKEHDENESVYFIAHAYEFAHYNEIYYYFQDLEEEDYNNDWKELFDGIPDNLGIIRGVYLSWLNYNHPEYYNFFTYEDLISIIKYWLKHNQQ